MKKKLLAFALALTMCLGSGMTANAAMIVKNNMSALNTLNTINKNTSSETSLHKEIMKKYKITYTPEALEALRQVFKPERYAIAYPDVAKAFGNDSEALWNHFVIFGLNEGRSDINSDFNVFAYSSAYPDLQKAFGDDLLAYYVHYVNFGIKENRKYTTIDATTKAGFTVSGMNGQILASPRLIVPSSADNSSVSNILSSLTLPSSAAPTPVPTPAPTPEPTTPEPEVPCNHEFDGRKQITGTTMHGPVCVLCGYINEEQAESCIADHYTADDSSRKEICGACGGVIKEESHLYTYTTETAEGGVRIHKGTCSVCGHTMDGACVFDPDGICEICGQPRTHEYTVGQSLDESYHQLVCKFCGHTEKEEHQIGESADSQKYCTACGYSLNE